MDRRYELAIDEKFERLVRESPRPRLVNGNLPGEYEEFDDQSQQQIVRPVPVGIVRNRANTSLSPHPRLLVSPRPQYPNTGSSTPPQYVNAGNSSHAASNSHGQYFSVANRSYVANASHPQFVNMGDRTHNENVNESIEEIFDYIKQKSFESSRKESYFNVSNVNENDQSGGYAVSKDVSVETDDSDSNSDDVDTIEQSYTAEVAPDHDMNVDNRHDKIVSSTVHSDCDADGCDTDNGGSYVRDKNEEVLQEVPGNNDNHMNVGDDQIDCLEIEEGENSGDLAVEQTTGIQKKEPCVLYMWIIKPIPGTCCICVEGKKHPDEDEFWKSGMVTQRLDAGTVLTHSGSIYKLVGDIEFADAVYAGFSQETVAAFRHGFPENWVDIIDDHFNSSSLDRTDKEETTLVSSSVDEAPAFTQKQSTITTKGKTQNYSLSNWVPKPLGQGICVVGVNQDGMLWHSSAIEKRLKSKRLATSSGSICTLKGHIDKLQAREENIPNEIITKFHTGFPKDWQELVQEYFTPDWFRKNEEAKNKKPTVGKKTDKIHEKATPKNDVKQKLAKTDQKIKRASTTEKKVQQKRKDSANKTLPARINTSVDSELADTSVASESALDQTVITPVGSFVNLSNLKRSRSGRLLRPPLHPWMGIHYEKTEDGIKLRGTEYAKSVLKEMEDQRKNASNVFARYKYTSKLDSTISSVSSVSSASSKSSLHGLSVGSSKKKTPASQIKKIDTSVSKIGKKDINSRTATSSSMSKGKVMSDASLSKQKISHNAKSKGATLSKNKDSSASLSKNDPQRKKKPEISEDNVVKKIVVTKTNMGGSSPSRSKTLKIQQAPAEDTDPKLDEEVFVMLKEMKENFLKSKSPRRTTCYDSVGKVSRSTRSRGKRLDGPEDSYTLDESGEMGNSTKNGNESAESVSEKNELSNIEADTDKSNLASDVSGHSKDVSKSGHKKNAKTKKKTEKASNLPNESEKSNVDKNEDKTLNENRNSKGISTREMISLMPQGGVSDSQTYSDCYSTPSRVLRSKLRRNKTINYRESSEDNTPKAQNENKKQTKVGDHSGVSETMRKIKTEETKDTKNKMQANKKNKTVNKANNRQKGKTCSEENEKVDHSKEEVEEKTKKSTKNNEKVCPETKSASNKKNNKNQQNKKEIPKEVSITANVGTLKRRLQTKAFLEKQNENYVDEIFDSTPFRNSRKRKRPLIEDIDDDELFEELARKQGKSHFETPAGGDPRQRSGRTLKLASARKTPACYDIKDDMIGSTMKNIDGYVHNIKKRQMLRAHRKLRNQTPRLVKKTSKDDSPQKKLFQEFINANKEETDNYKDSDNEEDYYWDEETA